MGVWRTAGVLTVLAGCSIGSEPDYVEARASAECRRSEACEQGFFEAEYSSIEDCVGERSEPIENSNEALEDSDCEYDPAEAGSCVSRIRAMSCEEWAEGEIFSACDLVWNCVEG